MKMKIQIQFRNGKEPLTYEAESIAEAVRQAIENKDELSNADLSRADLSKADLTHANLNGADLSYAYLNNTDLMCKVSEAAGLLRVNPSKATGQC